MDFGNLNPKILVALKKIKQKLNQQTTQKILFSKCTFFSSKMI